MVVALALYFAIGRAARVERPGATGQDAVLAAYDSMIAAAEALNVDELYRQVLDNDQGPLAINGQLLLTRASALERTRASFLNLTHVKYRVAGRHVTMLGADAAVLVATGTSQAEFADGRSFASDFVHTVVFVRRDGAWRVIHSHQSTPAPR